MLRISMEEESRAQGFMSLFWHLSSKVKVHSPRQGWRWIAYTPGSVTLGYNQAAEAAPGSWVVVVTLTPGDRIQNWPFSEEEGVL